MTWSVVIPTVGRPSLTACLSGLAASVASADVGGRAGSSAPAEVVLVDDRPLTECGPLPVEIPSSLRLRVVYGCGNGPAAARNAGWRTVGTPWVVFLDDDVVPGPSWAADLAADLADADQWTGAVQGRIEVPLPTDRRPTDAERNTAGLATAAWITADIAYRVSALTAVGGFDERFRRAFREDADLALRVQDAGWHLAMGRRTTVHPVRTDDAFASVRAQAGNADDVLMTRLHGDGWWERADAPRGRFARHVVVTAAGMAAVALGLAGRRRAAGLAAGAWLAGTAEFAAARIAPGPRTPREIATMLATSALIPPAALTHHLRGRWRHRHAEPWPPEPWPHGAAAPAAPAAVLDTVPAGPAAPVTAESGVVAR